MPAHADRRRFLTRLIGILATGVLHGPATGAATSRRTRTDSEGDGHEDPRIGIALGAGGASGLAHILMLEVLDEMSIRPHRISGSSIGAVIGALYASGMSGEQIRQLVEKFILSSEEGVIDQLINEDALRWTEFVDIDPGEGGLVSSEGFISYLYELLQYNSFDKLAIPLKIVAADYWERKQVVLDSGLLLPAVRASMALPGVFKPVMIDGRVLVDGGTVNPVPYDLLLDDCDIVIAIDVIGKRAPSEGKIPDLFETIFNSVKIMQHAIMAEKLRQHKPTIYISPEIVDIRALEFYRAEQVFEQARPARDELKRQLRRILNNH